jgi:hypothetical protein
MKGWKLQRQACVQNQLGENLNKGEILDNNQE